MPYAEGSRADSVDPRSIKRRVREGDRKVLRHDGATSAALSLADAPAAAGVAEGRRDRRQDPREPRQARRACVRNLLSKTRALLR